MTVTSGGLPSTLAALPLLVCLLLPDARAADPVRSFWVSEGLQVGLHQEATLDSAITALLKSGTELEVLERTGSLVRVRAGDGSVGWMDARYVTDNQPAIRLLEGARDALTQAERRTAALDARVDELEESAARLVERNAKLDGERAALAEQLDAERAKRAEAEADRDAADTERSRLQAELDSLASGPLAEGESVSNALRDIQRLAEENRGLKQEIAILEANQELVATAGEDLEALPARDPTLVLEDRLPDERSESASSEGTVSGQPNLLGFVRWQPWQWMLLASALLLSFGAGGWLVDYRVRRRHGGFRI